MNREMAISILEKCKNKLKNMTVEEYEQKKKDLGLQDKVYVTDSYVTNLIQVLMLNKNL